MNEEQLNQRLVGSLHTKSLEEQFRQRLVDIHLQRRLGGEKPPDVKLKVLDTISTRSSVRIIPFPAWISVAAAAAVLICGFWFMYAKKMALDIKIVGNYTVVGGGDLKRGAIVETSDKKAELSLGDYTTVRMKPQTRIKILGQANKEKILLVQGDIACDVIPEKGGMEVATEAGSVLVTGTKFNVTIKDHFYQEISQEAKALIVRVSKGSVYYSSEKWASSQPVSEGYELHVAYKEDEAKQTYKLLFMGYKKVAMRIEHDIDDETDSLALGERPLYTLAPSNSFQYIQPNESFIKSIKTEKQLSNSSFDPRG
jgi:hypothetical protein